MFSLPAPSSSCLNLSVHKVSSKVAMTLSSKPSPGSDMHSPLHGLSSLQESCVSVTGQVVHKTLETPRDANGKREPQGDCCLQCRLGTRQGHCSLLHQCPHGQRFPLVPRDPEAKEGDARPGPQLDTTQN